ncbi:hypothetical protein PM082_006625 [Marasmius tenuissimus]|nr:hypothetical protein PM082_006625 [Marasmius tenuissimus]
MKPPPYIISPEQKAFFEENGYLVLPTISSDLSKNIVEWTYEVKSLPHRSDAWMHYDEVIPGSKGERTLSRTENFADYHQGFNDLFRGKLVLGILKQLSGEEMVLFKEKINYKVVAGSQNPPEPIPLGEDQCISDEWCAKQTWTPVPLETGQLLIFGSYLAHRSADNKSPNGRAAIYVTYNALSEGGDMHEAYYENRRQHWPPTADRAPGQKYEAGARMYAFGSPMLSVDPEKYKDTGL